MTCGDPDPVPHIKAAHAMAFPQRLPQCTASVWHAIAQLQPSDMPQFRASRMACQ